MRLHGDQVTADPDDGDAGHASERHIGLRLRVEHSASGARLCTSELCWDLCPGCDRAWAEAVR
jgi:hypothetical protein